MRNETVESLMWRNGWGIEVEKRLGEINVGEVVGI